MRLHRVVAEVGSAIAIHICSISSTRASIHAVNGSESLELCELSELSVERVERPGAQGKSSKTEEYLCFPTHYCSCRAFQWDVISRGDQLICKHQLAARLAEATGLHASSVVTDLLLAQLLEAYMVGYPCMYQYQY